MVEGLSLKRGNSPSEEQVEGHHDYRKLTVIGFVLQLVKVLVRLFVSGSSKEDFLLHHQNLLPAIASEMGGFDSCAIDAKGTH